MKLLQVTTDEGAFCDLRDRIVVSPTFGRARVRQPSVVTTEGEVVYRGDVIAEVDTGGETVGVRAPCDAWVVRVLCPDGHRVDPGRPLVHLIAL